MQQGSAQNSLRNRLAANAATGALWYDNAQPGEADKHRRLVELSQMQPGPTFNASMPDIMLGKEFPWDYKALHISPLNTWAVHEDLGNILQTLAPAGNWVGVAVPDVLDTNWTALIADNALLTSEFGALLLYPDPLGGTSVQFDSLAATNMWLVAIDPNIRPRRLQRADGTWMIRGIDFFSEFGVLGLYEDPALLWPKQYTVACSTHKAFVPYAYTLQLDCPSGVGYWVWRYYRYGQGLTAFKKALAEASGLLVFPSEGAVLQVIPRPVGYIYLTTVGEFNAFYGHTPLVEGSLHHTGQIVDGGALGVSVTGNEITVTLEAPLLGSGSLFNRRARTFATRERPFGFSVTFDEP